MEDNARELARQDGITDGLVCAYGAMENCRTFRVQYSDDGPKVRSDQRVCLVIYFYWMDCEFGLMHVKIQTWFPFTMQVYVNGHEWLARLTARGIAFEKHDNGFDDLAHVAKANDCPPGFWRREWASLLYRLAGRVNPLLKDWLAGQNYYWVIDQAEFSTDVLFANKTAAFHHCAVVCTSTLFIVLARSR